MANNVYRLTDVSEHNGRDSCWIVIDSKVYDVTKYIDEHPGGDEYILNVAGMDGTQDFRDIGHSAEAREILSTMLIGALHSDDVERLKFEKEDRSMQPWLKIAAIAAVPSAIGLLALLTIGRGK